jgi:hypothetical protein
VDVAQFGVNHVKSLCSDVYVVMMCFFFMFIVHIEWMIND